MRFTVAFCAVLIGCGAALSAPRTNFASNPFDEVAPRPPAAIPHVRPTHAASVAPVPRPKPAEAAHGAPMPAPGGPIVFPPVAPLE